MTNNITEFLNGKADNVELKAETIELTIVGDMKKEMTKAEKELALVKSLKQKAKQPLEDAKTANKAAGVAANNALKFIESFKTQAKELGVDVPADIKAIETRANNIISEFKASQPKLQSITAEL